MHRKGSASAGISIILVGYFGVLAVKRIAQLKDLAPIGHQSDVILFVTGLLIFGTIAAVVEALA